MTSPGAMVYGLQGGIYVRVAAGYVSRQIASPIEIITAHEVRARAPITKIESPGESRSTSIVAAVN